MPMRKFCVRWPLCIIRVFLEVEDGRRNMVLDEYYKISIWSILHLHSFGALILLYKLDVHCVIQMNLYFDF
jgi:hypothetical protein